MNNESGEVRFAVCCHVGGCSLGSSKHSVHPYIFNCTSFVSPFRNWYLYPWICSSILNLSLCIWDSNKCVPKHGIFEIMFHFIDIKKVLRQQEKAEKQSYYEEVELLTPTWGASTAQHTGRRFETPDLSHIMFAISGTDVQCYKSCITWKTWSLRLWLSPE